MPEYSKSLGCLKAPHFFQDSANGALYTIPVGINVDHNIDISGGAVGTLVLAPSTSIGDDAIKVRASVRTDDASLLEHVKVHTPESAPLPPQDGKSSSYFSLITPNEASNENSCLRYDVTVYLPPTLRTLRIHTSSVAQVKLDFDHAPRELHSLDLDLTDRAAANLLLTSSGLIADNVDIKMRGGYLVGALALANSTRVDTLDGDAITKLSVITSGYAIPDPSEDDDDVRGAVAHLATFTGKGRADFEYENRAGRPVRSEHFTYRQGELRLTYEQARFNGRVEVEARSYSMRKVQSDMTARPGDKSVERWVGEKEGGDLLKVGASGWVGIYF